MAHPEALDFRRERLNDLPKLLRSTRRERFTYAEALAKDKETFRNVLLLWLAYWRDVLLRVAGSESPIINVDRSEEIGEQAGHLSLPEAHRLVADLEGAVEQLEKNANARLLAEVVLLDWPRS
jgi:DNA polymerase III gamma/tau subunit